MREILKVLIHIQRVIERRQLAFCIRLYVREETISILKRYSYKL